MKSRHLTSSFARAGRSRAAIASFVAAMAVLIAMGVWSSWASAGGGGEQDHGIAFIYHCMTPTVVGDPYACKYDFINSPAIDTALDILTVVGISAVIHASPADVASGPILDQMTISSTKGGGFCEDSDMNVTTGGVGAVGSGTAPIAKCTLPGEGGSRVSFNFFSFYTVDGDDPGPLANTATVEWIDTCTGGSTNCPTTSQFAEQTRSVMLITPTDSDGDGCPNVRELVTGFGAQNSGGNRDPLNPWDYFNPSHDSMNRVDDILLVVDQYFIDQGNPGYNPDFDRTLLGPNAWNLGPPNGLQRVDDILKIVKQYFHDCA